MQFVSSKCIFFNNQGSDSVQVLVLESMATFYFFIWKPRGNATVSYHHLIYKRIKHACD